MGASRKSSRTSTSIFEMRARADAYAPATRATESSSTKRGTRMKRARRPRRHAASASAAAMYVLPTPVGPITTTFCFARTHWQVASWRIVAFSMPRAASQTTSSMLARVASFASFRRRTSRRFSRSVHSRSTSMAILSSQDSCADGGESTSSRITFAIVASFRSISFWMVSSVIFFLLLVVIGCSADVLVRCRRQRTGRRLDRDVFASQLQDRLDVLAARTGRSRRGQGVRARGIGASRAVLLRASDHAERRAVTHLRPRVATQDAFDDAGDVRSEARGPAHHAFGRPLAVLAMRARAMFIDRNGGPFASVAARVRRDAFSSVKDLDDARRRSNLDALTHQSDGHAVEAIIERDVVIDVHASFGPFAHLVAASRQRLHHRPIEALER